jgi:von Willebrand factor type A domain
MLRFSLTLLAVFAALPSAFAQSNISEIVTELKTKTPKCILLIVDVSESMRVDDYTHKMHDAAETILKEGLSEGDQAVLYTFGAGSKKIFDEAPSTPAARRKLIEQVPLKPESGEGTNIRQPHHEALKLARASGKTPFIVILTDSFNDPPKNSPDAYNEYLKYYTPGKLEVYPNTPENQDYETQLAWMNRSGGKTFGVGVEIMPSGRPKERFKIAPKETTPASAEPSSQNTSSASPPPPKSEEFPIGLLIGVAGVALAGVLYALLRPKPMPLRIAGSGPPRDFDVRGNTVLRLGGEGGSAALDAYPIVGTREVVALVKGGRGQLTLEPQPSTKARVYHNGVPLEKSSSLRYGDEVRVSLLDPNGTLLRETRLKFSDPNQTI